MNTRRKVAQQKPEVHSTKWHLLHESYYPIFAEATRGSVEDWYNLEASGIQRDQFRALCSRIYTTAPAAPDAAAPMPAAPVEGKRKNAPGAVPTQTELVMREEEARTMLLHYGEVLSTEGKARARGWLLQPSTSKRDKTIFRELLLGCQPHKPAKGVLKTDYIPPAGLDDKVYDNVDRTHFQRSVDWNNLKAREEMQQVQQQRGTQDVQSAHMAVLGSGIDNTTKKGEEKKRITKPKSQFDNVNYLSSLGYDGMTEEEALADIHKKRAEGKVGGGASGPAGTYEVKEDGSTVYIAGGGRKKEAVKSENMTAVNAEPMAEWKVKTLQ